MPDLPGSNPEMDIEMFKYVYSVVCPDQMKGLSMSDSSLD